MKAKNLAKLILIGVCLISLTATDVSAHGHKRQPIEKGAIRNVELDHKTLTVLEQPSQLIRGVIWDDHTKFEEKGKKIPPADLRVGERIAIKYVKKGDVLLAKLVRVLPEKRQAMAK